MGEQFGNLVRQYPWHIVCLVSLLFIVVQGLLIFLAKKNNWSLRVRPIQNTYVCCIVYMFIIYDNNRTEYNVKFRAYSSAG